MENKQPTGARIKEFWVGCGLHHNKPTGGFFWDKDDNLVIDMHKGETGVDLNNLFKYAMIRLDQAQYYKALSSLFLKQDNPALALFWAVWEVIKP